jgi:hypothetical protein
MTLPVRVHGIAGQPAVVRVHDVPGIVKMELAVAAVRDRAVLAHAEETAAVYRDIERIIGYRDVALGKFLLDLRDLGADADRIGAGSVQRVRVDVREKRVRGLEAHDARVGDVVADDVEILRGGAESAQSGLECH